jgi:hypothetical protein
MLQLLQNLAQPEYKFPSLLNPYAEQVKQENDHWLATRYSFLRPKMLIKYQTSNFGYLSARCLPDIRTYEHLSLAAEFMLLGTIYDDYYEFENVENLEHMRHRIHQVLNDKMGELTDTFFVQMFAELGKRFQKIMGYSLDGALF